MAFHHSSFIKPVIYCGRGITENFINEGKSGFSFVIVSSHSKMVNVNRISKMIAYDLFN